MYLSLSCGRHVLWRWVLLRRLGLRRRPHSRQPSFARLQCARGLTALAKSRFSFHHLVALIQSFPLANDAIFLTTVVRSQQGVTLEPNTVKTTLTCTTTHRAQGPTHPNTRHHPNHPNSFITLITLIASSPKASSVCDLLQLTVVLPPPPIQGRGMSVSLYWRS